MIKPKIKQHQLLLPVSTEQDERGLVNKLRDISGLFPDGFLRKVNKFVVKLLK